MRAYSLTSCQIAVLHVQNKLRTSKAAMQRLHGVWQNFVMFVSGFRRAGRSASLFWGIRSYSASAKDMDACGWSG
jgi:hypothetical protein